MSDVTLEDIAEESSKETLGDVVEENDTVHESPGNSFLSRILTAETGEGNISDYIDHPMNFSKSEGLAQILRGVTGIAGNLKLAIIDIGMGVMRFSKERGKVDDRRFDYSN